MERAIMPSKQTIFLGRKVINRFCIQLRDISLVKSSGSMFDAHAGVNAAEMPQIYSKPDLFLLK
jgi:hypothetical protein